jgi:hypothetical protein
MPLDLEETKTLLRRTPDVLDVLLHGLPDPWVREDEGPDTWSSLDVVGHLIEAEGTNWIPRVRHLIAHGEPAVFSPFDRFGFVEKSKGRSMAEMLAVVLAGLYFTAQTLRIGQERRSLTKSNTLLSEGRLWMTRTRERSRGTLLVWRVNTTPN